MCPPAWCGACGRRAYARACEEASLSTLPTASAPACRAQDAFTVLTYLLSLELIYVSFALALKRAGGVLLAVLGGRVLFKEVVTPSAWAAIMVMIVGVILIVTS